MNESVPQEVNTTTDHRIPREGNPNSVTRKIDRNTGELISERHYGPDGRAVRDVHHTDHGNPADHPHVPHQHGWTWPQGDIGPGMKMDRVL